MSDVDDPRGRGRHFAAARVARGLTQHELGRRVGATQSLIGQLERGVIARSKFDKLIMYELGVLDDADTVRFIVAARRARDADAAPARTPSVAEAPSPAATSPSAPGSLGPSQGGHAGRHGSCGDPLRRSATPDAASPAAPDPSYESFAASHLRIRTKRGAIEPLVFNRAQRHIHAALEAQKARTGKVRALILKGRQQGCSTYVGGRYYHRASRERGLKVFILTHEEQAAKHLFEMVERFHEHCPDRPSIGVANASELYFDELDSGYRVGTAGTRGVGRSATLQLFHGSEVAFWPHAETHAAGILQAVADEPGTEIILESTANGVGHLFYKMWRDAEAGVSDYAAIFVPWYWHSEYRRSVEDDPGSGSGAGFTLTAEERDYAALYQLDHEQMMWRRTKIAELNDPSLFKQEYPASAAEAFQMSGHASYIPPALIARARKARCEPSGPLLIGYDPAWTGGDRHAMAWRRGRCVLKVETRLRLDTVQAAAWVRQVIAADRPAKLFIDVGGVGAGVYDQLVHLGEPYAAIVEPVNFSSAPVASAPLDEQGRRCGGPLNRRAEIWMRSREWLESAGGVQVPDSDALQADACGPGYRYDTLMRLALESKEDMRRRGALSPDQWDAVALTFAAADAGAAEPPVETSGMPASRATP